MRNSINDCINVRDKAKNDIVEFSSAMLNTADLLGKKGENVTFITKAINKELEAFARYDAYNEMISYKGNEMLDRYKKIMAIVGVTGLANIVCILLSILLGNPMYLVIAATSLGITVMSASLTITIMKTLFGSELDIIAKRFYNEMKLKALGKVIKASLFLKKSKGKKNVKAIYEILYKSQGLKNESASVIIKSNKIISMYSKTELGGRYETEEEIKNYTGYNEFNNRKMIKEFSGNDAELEKRANMDIYGAVGELRIMMDDFTTEEKREFYPELNDIVSRYNNYMASSERDIKVKVDIAKDIDILKNKINNTLKSKTGVKKRVLEHK